MWSVIFSIQVVRTTGTVRSKQWVRIRSQLYKDDLAQVEYVDYAENTVTVRLIPRIDYNLIRERATTKRTEGEAKIPPKPRGAIRPPQRLFEPELIRECGADYRRDGDMYVSGQNRYTLRGFLIKSFQLRNIIIDGVKPSLTELEKFSDSVDMDLSEVRANHCLVHRSIDLSYKNITKKILHLKNIEIFIKQSINQSIEQPINQ